MLSISYVFPRFSALKWFCDLSSDWLRTAFSGAVIGVWLLLYLHVNFISGEELVMNLWYTKFNYITSPAIENSPSLLLFSTQSIYQGGRSSILIRYDFESFRLSTFHATFCVYFVTLWKAHMNRRRNVKFCQLSTLAIFKLLLFLLKSFVHYMFLPRFIYVSYIHSVIYGICMVPT